MGNGPSAVLDPEPLAPSRNGLVVSARRPEPDNGRWQNGYTYTPEFTCATPGIPANPCDISAGDIAIDAEPAEIEWEPYLLYAGVACTGIAANSRDWAAAARRRLSVTESFQLERELWNGDRASADSFPNRFFTDGTADSLTEAGSVGLTHGLACLEQYLAETLAGQRGMIHATPQVVTHWRGLNLVRRNGALLTTELDTIVVAGAGYTGDAPDGTAAADGAVWAYATGIVDVLLGEVEVDRVAAGTVDREINDVEVRAMRIGSASWDGCALGGARLDVTLCDIVGAS